jgi:hypothetical protein
MEYEVLLPKGLARKAIQAGLVILTLVGLTLLCRRVSPQEQGQPRLLSPGLAAVTAFQRDARRWTNDLKDIQNTLGELLSIPAGDLWAQDQLANELHGRLLGLAAELDGTRVPSTLESLRVTLEDTTTATLEACMALTGWLNEPTPENTSLAQTALQEAEGDWDRLDQNPWVAQP